MPPRWISNDQVIEPTTGERFFVVIGQTQILLGSDNLFNHIFNCFIIGENLPQFKNDGGIISLRDKDGEAIRLLFPIDKTKGSALISVRILL